jgi:hypothetical protein
VGSDRLQGSHGGLYIYIHHQSEHFDSMLANGPYSLVSKQRRRIGGGGGEGICIMYIPLHHFDHRPMMYVYIHHSVAESGEWGAERKSELRTHPRNFGGCLCRTLL